MAGFFSRWQERREQVAQEEQELAQQAELQQTAQQTTDAQAAVDPTVDHTSTEQAAEQADAEPKLLTAEDLPDPTQIEEGGSFAQFMGDNVDPEAQKLALRALWKQPHFNEVCPMCEYALDYGAQPLLDPLEAAEIAKKLFKTVDEKLDQALDKVDQLADKLEQRTHDDAEQDEISQPELTTPVETAQNDANSKHLSDLHHTTA